MKSTDPPENGVARAALGRVALSAAAAGLACSATGCAVASIWLMGGLFPLSVVLIAYPAVLLVPLCLVVALVVRRPSGTLFALGPGLAGVVLGVVEIATCPVDAVLPGLVLVSSVVTVFCFAPLTRCFLRHARIRLATLLVGLVVFGASAWRLGLLVRTVPLCLCG